MPHKLSEKALDAFKKVPNYAMKLGIEIGCNKQSAEKYVEINSILLTTRDASALIQQEAGLTDKEFWVKGQATPIRKTK